MAITRSIAIVPVLVGVAWLGGFAAEPRGTTGEDKKIDLVLDRSFVHLPDELQIPQVVYQVGFSGRLVACFCSAPGWPGIGPVYLWDTATGKRSADVGPAIAPAPFVRYSFATVPHARLCFWTATGLEVRDDLTKPARRRLKLKLLHDGVDVEGRLNFPIDGDGSAEMGRVYFSADDAYIAAVRFNKTVHVWSAKTGDHLWRLALPKQIATEDAAEARSFAFDPKNRYLAVGLDGASGPNIAGGVIVWDLKTGKEVLHTGENYRVFEVAFSPDGDLMCAEAGQHPDAIDAPGRVVIREERAPGNFGYTQLIYTPQGLYAIALVPHVGIATGDNHGQVMLWNPDTGRLLAVAKENGRSVASLAASRDGTLLVSGDFDGVARLWRIVAERRPVRLSMESGRQ